MVICLYINLYQLYIMGIFDIEERVEKDLTFIEILQKKIDENMVKNRVLVIVTGEYWDKYNRDKLIFPLKDSSFHLSLYPKPWQQGYGNNFPLNLIDLFKEKGDIVLFNHVERICESQEKLLWEYLLNLAAKGEVIPFNKELKFDFSRKGLILVGKEVPEFIKSNPQLYPLIIHLDENHGK